VVFDVVGFVFLVFFELGGFFVVVLGVFVG